MTLGRPIPALATIVLSMVVCACAATGTETSKAASDGYGPLTFNRSGADFYFAQAGQFARAELSKDGVIEIHLANAPFQLGYNGRQLNIALAQLPIPEISTDPQGFQASRLSGAMTGGREENSDVLLVYAGSKWSDGNTEFSDHTSRKASPMPGFQFSYQVNEIDFVDDEHLTLGNFKGTLHGFIVVYKQRERKQRDIMPIRLILGGHAPNIMSARQSRNVLRTDSPRSRSIAR